MKFLRKHIPEILYLASAVIIGGALFLVYGCGSSGNPSPVPQPTPIPTPTPMPSPTVMLPLKVSGPQFVTDRGPMSLLGALACCEAAKDNGWPWVNEAFLNKLQAASANYTELRNGPNDGSESPTALFLNDPKLYGYDGYVKTVNGKYDLTKFDPVFWAAFNKIISLASQKGIYIGVDVVDRWVLRNHLSPWQQDRNVQGAEYEDPTIAQKTPRNWHQAWITKIATEAGKYPNVIFLSGNEGFLPIGACAKPWEEGMADIIRAVEKANGYQRHLFGSNCQVPEIERSVKVDFVIIHSKVAVSPHWNKPTMVNEEGDMLTAAEWLKQARQARALGSSFQLWRGNMKADFEGALAQIKAIREGQ